MSGKRPIKVFYIPKQKPKRSISQRSTSQLLSNSSQVLPSFASFSKIDELHPYDSSFEQISTISNLSQRESSSHSSSKLISNDSFLSKTSQKEKEAPEKKNRKKWLPVVVALIIAACLIAVVVLLAVNLSKKGKVLFFS